MQPWLRTPLFGLAPGGVCRAASCYQLRGALLPHLFTLTGRGPAVYFLWHFPWARALQALPGALSEGARTFLCNGNAAAIASPTPTFLDRGFYSIAGRLRIIATLVEFQESGVKIVRFAAADSGGYFRRFLGRQVCREFK